MLAVVTVLLTVTGCAPRIRHVPQEVLVSGVDLRAHTREGFLFSPNAYTGQFEAVGLVTVSVYAEARFQRNQRTQFEEWAVVPVPLDSALAAARRSAAAMGANALVNLSLRAVSKPAADVLPVLTLPGVEVSGFAIRRAN